MSFSWKWFILRYLYLQFERLKHAVNGKKTLYCRKQITEPHILITKSNLITGPASNVYRIPTAIGFTGHTSIKRRLPAVTFGKKCDSDPKHGHGLLYNLRQQSRFGKLHHQPNYHFSSRKSIAKGILDWIQRQMYDWIIKTCAIEVKLVLSCGK